jgi:hypothetical protein
VITPARNVVRDAASLRTAHGLYSTEVNTMKAFPAQDRSFLAAAAAALILAAIGAKPAAAGPVFKPSLRERGSAV